MINNTTQATTAININLHIQENIGELISNSKFFPVVPKNKLPKSAPQTTKNTWYKAFKICNGPRMKIP
jgi:hypothetical protein